MTERTLLSCDGTQEGKQPSLGSVPISLVGVRGDGCLAAALRRSCSEPDSVPDTEAESMAASVSSLPLDTIICGDNATVLAGFPDGCIDLTVTSPPYDSLTNSVAEF